MTSAKRAIKGDRSMFLDRPCGENRKNLCKIIQEEGRRQREEGRRKKEEK
ncbi:MAG: hypothetical protein HC894_05490 [Microcoleus sp. SM1_3_4]|nr:hypothetical protein [Microcoleus sp. SM1_3_4]